MFPVPGHNQAIGTALSPDKKNSDCLVRQNKEFKNITFGLWKLIIGSFTIVMIGIGNDHTGWLWCDDFSHSEMKR